MFFLTINIEATPNSPSSLSGDLEVLDCSEQALYSIINFLIMKSSRIPKVGYEVKSLFNY